MLQVLIVLGWECVWKMPAADKNGFWLSEFKELLHKFESTQMNLTTPTLPHKTRERAVS